MMFIIGVYLLVLSILFDEGTTLMIILRGLGSLETNPLYLYFGFVKMYIILFLCYIATIYVWGWILKIYKMAYKSRAKGYKLFDVVVFMFCFALVFISFTKIEVGYSNLGIIIDSYDEEKSVVLNQSVQEIEEIRVAQPEAFNEVRIQQYKENTYVGISYFKFILISLFSFLLFKVGLKVCPYEYA